MIPPKATMTHIYVMKRAKLRAATTTLGRRAEHPGLPPTQTRFAAVVPRRANRATDAASWQTHSTVTWNGRAPSRDRLLTRPDSAGS